MANVEKKQKNTSAFQKRNLLKEIYEKKITEKEAEDIWLNVEGSNAYAQIGINTYKERLAVDAIPFKILAKWRYEGWPTVCAICNKPCDMDKNEGYPVKKWRVNNKIKRNFIIHKECEPLPYADYRELEAWHIIEKAIDDLEKLQEIRITTVKDNVVGYIVSRLARNKKTKEPL